MSTDARAWSSQKDAETLARVREARDLYRDHGTIQTQFFLGLLNEVEIALSRTVQAPVADGVREAWDRPIEELCRAKAGLFWDEASQHPAFKCGSRDTFIDKNWSNWREDAAVEIAALASSDPTPAAPAQVEAKDEPAAEDAIALHSLQQAILQCRSPTDFVTVQKTVKMMQDATIEGAR